MSKKLIAFALAGIFALSMVAPAKAATIEELTILFNDLLAKYNVLLAQVGQPTGAAAVCFNTDLQKGMTSDDVKNLQIKLGVTPTSGYFGSITFAAVKTFQTANGIINTGYVGPLTRGALNALYCVAVTPVTTYPAGCTSAVGFSSTTGDPCSTVVTYPAGCTSAVGFSPTTGAPCSTTVTYPEGCTSVVGFSSTTGLSCAGTTTTTVGPSYGTLSVVSYPLSNPQTTLYGGATSELVAGQYKATGSDMTVRKVSVKIVDDDTTTFPWQVFSAISIWDGATKLGEVTLTSANMIQTTFAHSYTVDISGLTWAIPNGTQKVLTVKGTVVPNAVTAVTVAGQSYVVSLLKDGVISTDTAGVTYTSASGLDLASSALTISSSQLAAITTTLATDNPLAGNVIGSTSATTRVDLLKFNVKVENSNVTFNSGTITATSTYATTTVSVELWDGSTLVTTAAPAASGLVTWSNFTLPIAAGTTKILTVKGVIAQLATGYNAGDTVQISTGPVLTGVDANSNVVSAAGALVTGNAMKIYLIAPTFTYSTSGYTVSGTDTTHTSDIGVASITFTVTAKGGDIYIATTTTMTDTLNGGTASAVAATGAITFTTIPTGTGTATVTINTTNVTYTYTTSTPLATVAAGIVTAIEANATTTALVAATSSDGTVNLTAKTAGYAGNSITYSATTTASTGITVTPITSTNMTGGIDATASSDAWSCDYPAETNTNANFWRIPSGSTASCTFTDHITNTNATAGGWFQPKINNISWMTTATTTGDIDQSWGLTGLQTVQFYLGI